MSTCRDPFLPPNAEAAPPTGLAASRATAHDLWDLATGTGFAIVTVYVAVVVAGCLVVLVLGR